MRKVSKRHSKKKNAMTQSLLNSKHAERVTMSDREYIRVITGVVKAPMLQENVPPRTIPKYTYVRVR